MSTLRPFSGGETTPPGALLRHSSGMACISESALGHSRENTSIWHKELTCWAKNYNNNNNNNNNNNKSGPWIQSVMLLLFRPTIIGSFGTIHERGSNSFRIPTAMSTSPTFSLATIHPEPSAARRTPPPHGAAGTRVLFPLLSWGRATPGRRLGHTSCPVLQYPPWRPFP